jgi:predicted nucleic acid-binding Zn ribbon protein
MRTAAELLPQLYQRLAREAGDTEALVLALWPAVVGPRLAVHARAMRLYGAILMVETDSLSWRKELAPLTGVIVRNLNQAAGKQILQDVQFQLAVRAAARPPGRAASAKGSADAALAAQRDEAAGIKDPQLRRIYRQSRRRAQSK